MENSLQLVFRNESGSLFSINLANPRTGLTAAELSTAMDLVLQKNIFVSAGGLLTGKVRARLIARDVTDVVNYEQ